MIKIPSIKLTQKQLDFLIKLSKETNVTFDVIIRKLIDREIKRKKVK